MAAAGVRDSRRICLQGLLTKSSLPDPPPLPACLPACPQTAQGLFISPFGPPDLELLAEPLAPPMHKGEGAPHPPGIASGLFLACLLRLDFSIP